VDADARSSISRVKHYTVSVREDDDGSYWAEVNDLPGCFASGTSLDELKEAVLEAIGVYLADDDAAGDQVVRNATVDEIRVAIPA
jgi:predicted RNase H-like HicB family nuclease